MPRYKPAKEPPSLDAKSVQDAATFAGYLGVRNRIDELADLVHVSRETLYRWIRKGGRPLEASTVIRFADACGVDPIDLFSGPREDAETWLSETLAREESAVDLGEEGDQSLGGKG